MLYHHCWLEIYHHHQACACWQCAIIMSVFCHWIGISAEWPTTIGSWEHLLMCQRGVHYAWNYALCMAQKTIIRSFFRTTYCTTWTLLPELETLRIHAVSHQWEPADHRRGIAIRKRSVREKRVYAPKWKASLPWNTTKNRVTISWLLPP